MSARQYKLTNPLSPTAAAMTERVGEIQQRLPTPRRRKPSLPHVSMEGVTKHRVRVDTPQTANTDDRRKLTPAEQEHWLGTTDDLGFLTDGHRVMLEENLDVGAGTTKDGRRPRAYSTADGMARTGTIGHDEMAAVNIFRLKLLRQLGRSEGVGTYGNHPGGSDPATRSDRKGRALTGYEIDHDGGFQVVPDALAAAGRNRNERRELAELLFAAVGVENTDGERVFDEARALVLVQSVLRTREPLTLDQIGTMLTRYGPRSKQKPAAASSILREMFIRMALHLRLRKGTPWSDQVPRSLAEVASD